MNTKNFIEELTDDCKSKEKEERLIEQLKNKLNHIAEQWAEEVVEDIKLKIKNKARAGQYEIKNGKKTICCDIKPWRFNYKIEKKYYLVDSEKAKQDVELEKLLLELHERKIDTTEYCYTSSDFDDSYHYGYLDWSWTGKVEKSLSSGQIILGFITFGIFFLLCLSNEPDNYAYRQKRLYRGTKKLNYVSNKCLNFIKLKLKEEKIVFESLNIKFKGEWYTLSENINAEIPVKFMDDKDLLYDDPLFFIKSKVIFE